MFEIVLVLISLLQHEKADYISIQKYDTEESCKSAMKKEDMVVDTKLFALDKTNPMKYEMECVFYHNA